jgi:hypothetical protein
VGSDSEPTGANSGKISLDGAKRQAMDKFKAVKGVPHVRMRGALVKFETVDWRETVRRRHMGVEKEP